MNCDIYKSSIKGVYIFVPAKSPPATYLPKATLAKLGTLSLFKSIELKPDSPIIVADATEVIRNIEKKGFHVQEPEFLVNTKETSTVSEAGAAIGGGMIGASLGPVGALVGAVLGALLASAAKKKKNDSNA